MSSAAPAFFATSPRKNCSKKGKRRSSNDGSGSRSVKTPRVKSHGDHTSGSLTIDDAFDASQSTLMLQEPRRSARSGAGSGGKALQLQKIGTILENRDARTHRPTDLPESMDLNPLAPPSRRTKSGRRSSGKKDAPPPYVSDAPSQVHSLAVAAPPPVFHQRVSESERFGFSASSSVPQPMTSPDMVPNLRAHNNPYVAAREQQARPLPSSEFASHLSPGARVGQTHHTMSQAFDNRFIDPVLLGNPRPDFPRAAPAIDSNMTDRDSDSSESGETTGGSRAADEMEAEREEVEGWGATNSRRKVHPGFPQEPQRNSHARHSSLPPDHEFTFSRDEDDASALLTNLDHSEFQDDTAADVQSRRRQPNGLPSAPNPEGSAARGDLEDAHSQHGHAVDLLNHHHAVNGRPSAPDPRVLVISSSRSADAQESARSRAPRNSKKPKDAGPSPQNLGFYPSVWQDCLEDAKRECRVTHLLNNNPFPSKSRDLKTSITEALTTTITEWNNGSAVFEPNYWPDHKSGMACVLLGDMSTWRSELKSTAFAAAPVAYGLIPPQGIATREKAQWVQDTAAQLLKDGLFLRDGLDELGKTNNFVHPALKEVVMRFFYTGSYRIANKRPNLFRQAVPIPCLALAGAALNCVLDGFTKNGAATLKTMPQFTAKEYRSTFLAMMKMLNEILGHPYHGPKLRTQIGKWAQEGWAALHEVDVDVERDSHLLLVLD